MREKFEKLVKMFDIYVEQNNYKHCVLGVSGGIDSTLALIFACHKFGGKNVTPVYIPY